jgi:hypothetical protein
MKDANEEIRKFLDSIPDTFEILEESIDLETQKEYMEYSESFGRGELSEKETFGLSKLLNKPEIPNKDKKKILTILAHSGSILAFREIEKFRKEQNSELKKWSGLALQECKMFLESELTGFSMGFISTGLGGLKDKLRIYFLILPLNDCFFNENQQTIIAQEFKITAKELSSDIENIDPTKEYVGITALIPLTVAVGELIESGIKKCNELGSFVFEYYYATNEKIPDQEEIKEAIRIVRSD